MPVRRVALWLSPALLSSILLLGLTRLIHRAPTIPRELSVDQAVTARTPAEFINLSHAVDAQHWVFVVIALTLLLAIAGRFRQAVLLLVSEPLAEVLSALVKMSVNRQFPDSPIITPGLGTLDSLLFPSGHVVRTSVTLGLLALFVAWPSPRFRWPAVLAAQTGMALIGVTQVAVGGHLPLDALGGYLLAAAIVNVVYVAERWLAGPGSRVGQPLPVWPKPRVSAARWLVAAGLAAVVVLAVAGRPASIRTVAVAPITHARLLLAQLHAWLIEAA